LLVFLGKKRVLYLYFYIAIKNGKSGLTILPPLIINKENGEYTDEILKMFK